MSPTKSESEAQEKEYANAGLIDKIRMDIHAMTGINPNAGKVCPWDDQKYDTCAKCDKEFKLGCAPIMIAGNTRDVMEWLISHDSSQKTISQSIMKISENPVQAIRDIAAKSSKLWMDNCSDDSFTYLRSVKTFLEGKILEMSQSPESLTEEEKRYRSLNPLDRIRMDIHAMAKTNPKTGSVCNFDTPEQAQNYFLCAECPDASYECAPRAVRALELVCEESMTENLGRRIVAHDQNDKSLLPLIIKVVPSEPVEAVRLLARDTLNFYEREGFVVALANIRNAKYELDDRMIRIKKAEELIAKADEMEKKADKEIEILTELLELFDGSDGDERYKSN